MREQKNWDPSTCLDPTVRAQAIREMAEFKELAAWLEAIQFDLCDNPHEFGDPEYVAATAADVAIAVERVRELETVMRSFVE